jgi:hypothetical protein
MFLLEKRSQAQTARFTRNKTFFRILPTDYPCGKDRYQGKKSDPTHNKRRFDFTTAGMLLETISISSRSSLLGHSSGNMMI